MKYLLLISIVFIGCRSENGHKLDAFHDSAEIYKGRFFCAERCNSDSVLIYNRIYNSFADSSNKYWELEYGKYLGPAKIDDRSKYACDCDAHPANYLIDDSTGRRVTDSNGKMIIDTTHPWGHKPQIKTW